MCCIARIGGFVMKNCIKLKEEESTQTRNGLVPEWARFDYIENRFGIKRSFARKLIEKGEIDAASVKSQGSRGIKLVRVSSVEALLKRSKTIQS